MSGGVAIANIKQNREIASSKVVISMSLELLWHEYDISNLPRAEGASGNC